MAVEACVDVASHVIADRGLRVPSTYAETFEILVQAGLMSPGPGRVILRGHLGDFRRFEAEALRWLQ
jgi:uncharacterized protein YutE (UPF0331/DUF86 family)